MEYQKFEPEDYLPFINESKKDFSQRNNQKAPNTIRMSFEFYKNYRKELGFDVVNRTEPFVPVPTMDTKIDDTVPENEIILSWEKEYDDGLLRHKKSP